MKKNIFLVFTIVFFQSLKSQTLQWVKSIGGVNDDFGFAIKTDAFGNVYTAGRFENVVDFDPGPATYTLAANSLSDAFICKLDAAGNFLWARSYEGLGDGDILSIATDKFGSVYATGKFAHTMDFDPGSGTYTLTSPAGNFDTFITKLNANGDFVWARSIGNNNWDEGISLALDSLANVYSTGYFKDTVDFDPGPGTFTLQSSNSSAYILKLDAAGNFLWVKNITGPAASNAISICVDIASKILITGAYGLGVDFDPGPGTYTLPAVGTFLSKYDSNGNFVWAKSLGYFAPKSVKVNSAGDIHLLSELSGTTAVDCDPGPGTYTVPGSAGSWDILLTKYDLNGDFIWAKKFGSTDADRPTYLALDNVNNVYFIGYSNGVMDFDPGPGVATFSTSGNFNVFITRLNSNGDLVKMVQLGGTGNITGQGIEIDNYGNVYSTGYFSETVDFDPTTGVFNLISSPSGWHDIFIHKMSTLVGIRENNGNDFSLLYPNPTDGKIKCVIGQNADFNFYISDVSGKIIKSGNLKISDGEIDISEFSKGSYFLTMYNNEGRQTQKIILK